MMQSIKKELLIYFSIVVVLSAIMHQNAWVKHPLTHMKALPQSSFGLWHPLFFALGAYLLLSFVRLIFRFIKKLVTPKE